MNINTHDPIRSRKDLKKDSSLPVIMRFLLILTLALVAISTVQALDLADLDIDGIEVLRKEGLGDDHIVVDVPKPDIHYYASEPVALPAPAEAEEVPF